MARIVIVLACGLMSLVATAQVEAGCRRVYCGGCSDPCVTSGCGGCVTYSVSRGIGCGAGSGYVAASQPRCIPLDVAPSTGLKIVLVPEYVTEMRSVCSTEYKEENRSRVRAVSRAVPVTEDRVSFQTVFVPQTATPQSA